MSEGKLFITFSGGNMSPRPFPAKALINHFKLPFEIVEGTEELYKEFPRKRIPALLLKDGTHLTETLAISSYLASIIPDEKVRNSLIGETALEKSQILSYLSMTTMDLFNHSGATFLTLVLKKMPYFKPAVDYHISTIKEVASIFEERLTHYTYLVGERVTLADVHAYYMWIIAFALIFGPDFAKSHPALTRWYKTMGDHPIVKAAPSPFPPFAEKALDLAPKKEPKKKEEKKEQPKKAEKKAEKPAEAAPQQEKKPKHPLEALGRSTFVLDEWKRKYSNEDTRPVALPWFWENYNPEEYSLWKVEYKYNDELTMTFMSNNLVGGFFNRLSASTKYMFGSLVVYGENNNNGIIGAVMLRGQDHVPAFDVAPDWESYSYSKLDPTKEEDKEFVNNMWAWDKPVVINGESKEIADGKVLK
ncbi:Elongation factor 1-gamma 2 [Nakaseomyces bracarensis]|uniref:Elongation factor 1-gamma 2 n=1 Tax=Nakaseomyces bracarensis TaxID=273131 RepID=A0ABR4NUG3_9SACH